MKKLLICLLLIGIVHAMDDEGVQKKRAAEQQSSHATVSAEQVKKFVLSVQIDSSRAPASRSHNPLMSPRYGIAVSQSAEQVAQQINMGHTELVSVIQKVADGAPIDAAAHAALSSVRNITGDLSRDYPRVSLEALHLNPSSATGRGYHD